MRAVVYDYSQEPDDRLQFIEDHPMPKVGKDEILVRTIAAGLNPVDYKLATFPCLGLIKNKDVVGSDITGEVMETKNGFKKGDIVFGFASSGSLAEYAAVHPQSVIRKDEGISCEDAAGVGTAYVTALIACRAARVSDGSSVAIIGASGGCGTAAVQIAKALGATTIIGICSQKSSKLVVQLGATEVVHYDEFAMLEELVTAVPSRTLHGIIDCVTSKDDPDYEPICRPWLKQNGMYVALNSGSIWAWAQALLLPACLQPDGYRLVLCDKNQAAAKLDIIQGFIADGEVKVMLDSQYPFSKEGVAEAVQRQKSRRAKGKIIITF